MADGDLFVRYEGNPILTAKDWPYPANTVFNPAATVGPGGETVLLVRVEDRRGVSHLTVARSDDGLTGWRVDGKPTLLPAPDTHPEEEWGIEDARVTRLEGRDQWAVTCTAFSSRGPLVSLALTSDFERFSRLGPVLCPENKDAALFPEKIDGQWAMLHRPVTGYGANIWISYSPDLRHWGEHKEVLTGRSGAWWDARKVGLNAPPLQTPEGWLIVYHGVRSHCSGALYRLGLALLDLEDPSQVIARGDEYVMTPSAPYEMVGDVGGVVFPCGWVHDPKSDEVRLYYGGADTVVGVARAPLNSLLAFLGRG